jgi:hypothetical protein
LAMRATNGSPPDEKRIQFPIEDHDTIFDGRRCTDTRGGGYTTDLDGAEQATIREFQPFDRRYLVQRSDGLYHPFRLLADLNTTDKHRLLTRLIFGPTNLTKMASAASVRLLCRLKIGPTGSIPLACERV